MLQSISLLLAFSNFLICMPFSSDHIFKKVEEEEEEEESFFSLAPTSERFW